MVKKITKLFYVFILAVLFFQFSGCGTLLYPERKGQRGGRIDIGVALLDGIGLLFFLIPGIIAYAIDFSNGTIYLPNTVSGRLDLKDIKQVKFDPKRCNNATIEEIIKNETGFKIKLNQNDVKVYKLKSTREMMAHFADAAPGMKDNSLASARK